MSAAHHPHSLRVPLIGAGILISFVLTITTIAQATGVGKWRAEFGAPAQSLSLSFADRDDGAVVATDAANGAEVFVFSRDKHGFVRSTLRAVARERKLAGYDAAAPFTITLHEDGKLTLTDPLTGSRIVLNGFGAPNAAEFAQLFERSEG